MRLIEVISGPDRFDSLLIYRPAILFPDKVYSVIYLRQTKAYSVLTARGFRLFLQSKELEEFYRNWLSCSGGNEYRSNLTTDNGLTALADAPRP